MKTPPTPHPGDLAAITREAAILVGRAEGLGIVLTITQAPALPLAMGHFAPRIEVRPARELAEPLQGSNANGVQS